MGNQLALAQFCAAAWRKGALALCLALGTLGLGLSAKAQGRKGAIITFDPPGTGTGAFEGTYPRGITPAGAITGFYFDENFVDHGFLRAPDGTFTIFDPAGSFGTAPFSITPAGAITGFYFDAIGAFHGFLRARDGTFTLFDAPGAGTGHFRAPPPTTSTQRGRSRDNTTTRATFSTASCALRTAPSPPSTFRMQAQAPARAPLPQLRKASAQLGQSRETTLMRMA